MFRCSRVPADSAPPPILCPNRNPHSSYTTRLREPCHECARVIQEQGREVVPSTRVLPTAPWSIGTTNLDWIPPSMALDNAMGIQPRRANDQGGGRHPRNTQIQLEPALRRHQVQPEPQPQLPQQRQPPPESERTTTRDTVQVRNQAEEDIQPLESNVLENVGRHILVYGNHYTHLAPSAAWRYRWH